MGQRFPFSLFGGGTSGAGSISSDAGGHPTASGLKVGTSASLFNITAGGGAIETLTVNGQGKAVFTTVKQPGQSYVIDGTARLDAGSGSAVAPAAPTIQVTPGNGQNSVAWMDGANGGATITSHDVYRGTVSGSLSLYANVTGAGPFVDTGLSNGSAWIYQVVARNGVGPSVRSAEATGIPSGEKLSIVFAGQSLADYFFTRGVPRAARWFAESLRSLAGYPALRNVAGYTNSTLYHDGTNVTAADWTVRVANRASGGSALLSNSAAAPTGQNSHVNEQNGFGFQGNYWWNAPGVDNSGATGNVLDNNASGATWTQGPLMRYLVAFIVAEYAAGRPLNGVNWSQGTSDMTSDPTQLAAYELVLGMTFDLIRSTAGNSALPIFIHRLGVQYLSPEASAEGIKIAQRNVVAARSNIHFSGEEYPYRRAIRRRGTGLSFTSGTNTVTVPDGTLWDLNGGVRAVELPSGAYISAIAGHVLTLQRRVNGTLVAANFTATNAAGVLLDVDNVHLGPGSDGAEDLDGVGGTTNDTTQGFYALASASARYIASVLGLGGGAVANAAGPYVSGASVTRGTNVVRVALTHVSGTDFVLKDVTGWRVVVDGVSSPVLSVAKVDATHVDLTITASIGLAVQAVSAQYGYGAFNKSDQTQFVFDNAAPIAFPMQCRGPVTVTIAESSNVLTLGATETYVNATALSAYTAPSRSFGSDPVTGRRHMSVAIVCSANSISRAISSVTVGGVAATVVAGSFRQQNNAGNTQACFSAFYLVEVPTGASGDVVVTLSGSVARIEISTTPIYGLPSTSVTPFHVAGIGSAVSTDTLTTAINVAANGVVLAAVAMQGGTAQQAGTASLSGGPAAQTGRTISAASAQGDITWTGLTENTDVFMATVTASASMLGAVSFAPV